MCNCNHIEHFLIVASAITRYNSFSAFASFLSISTEVMSSETGLKICAITSETKKYKSIIKKKKKEKTWSNSIVSKNKFE